MLDIFIGAIFTNILLNNYLGIRLDKKNLVTIITSLVALISTIANYFIYNLLVKYNLLYLKNICFILVILIISYLVSLIFKKRYKDSLLPVMITNSLVLGMSLVIVDLNFDIEKMLIYSVGSSVGYILIMFFITYLNKEFSKRKVLSSFKGYPIMLITLSILYILLGRL